MEMVMAFIIKYWILDVFFLGILAIGAVTIYDVLQQKHVILHNFPLVGHFRYWLEKIGPELRQYIVANDKEETPFNRAERRWVYASAKGQNSYFGFGSTEMPPYAIGYPLIKHATFPFPEEKAEYPGDDPSAIPCLKIMGSRHHRRRPYRPTSIINVSAMSFGSLGERAISALNMGAKKANCYHNTGEGGISPHHCHGGDLIWQLGTGYFGARDPHGRFSLDKLIEQVKNNRKIRAIEIKLSQGAKPGKGGVLPGKKVTPEIAKIRGIPVGKDCISPNAHTEFHSVDTLIDFIEKVAEASGLPVGIKSAIGELDFWEELATRMIERQQGPDYIAIDGGEGGTGAAPLVFTDHVALPFKVGFSRVYQLFMERGLAHEIVWIGSAKLGLPEQAIVAFAMGCDLIQIAREAMISIGCIQAQKCHTGFCPAGIATQSKWFQSGVNVEDKALRFSRFIHSFRKELLSLSHAAGYQHPCQFRPSDIEISMGNNGFKTLGDTIGYHREAVDFSGMTKYTALP